MNTNGKAGAWILPNKLWSRMEKLLPRYVSNLQGSRLRVDLRSIAKGIFYVRRTGCQWKAIPREKVWGHTNEFWGKVWGHTNEFWTMRVWGHQGIFR